MVSLMSERRRELNPFPEKGTQNRSMFQRKARGMQAGTNPEEKERALATVTDDSAHTEKKTNFVPWLTIYTTTSGLRNHTIIARHGPKTCCV